MTLLFRKKKRRRRKGWWKKAGTMDRILVILGVFLLTFTVAMIAVFIRCGSVPDSLVNGVFLLCGGECGIMGWIKNKKEQVQARKWELEDRKNLREGGTSSEEL